ncbi:hypothetical protein VNI00_011465 [Paramarasmius palmivorus]|uniref:Heterokaryon incompatibility domain-containing protein n=1 Tax=Paramarasmius palmivorus TaxID=297713 RepID=A0AAW0CAK0_9AGAR
MEVALWNPPGEEVKDFDSTLSQSSLRSTEDGLHVIYREPLADLRTDGDGGARPINLTKYVTSCRYRFIDCLAFVRDEVLQLVETKTLPVQAYAAISHVWASLPPEETALSQRGTFQVECEESNDGGPISIDVLHHTSLAALQEGAQYIWLDRICILQTRAAGKNDKRWQIMNMHSIYLHSCVTLVLLAGLQRFVGRKEQTEWMSRAWTFQEAIVPPEAKVVFVDYSLVDDTLNAVVRMLPVDHYCKLLQSGGSDRDDGFRERRGRLIVALDNRDHFRGNDLPDIFARFHTIWDFVQWRTSARQADVVFSIMGMLDITLDPSDFDRNDRMGATLAMAQEILCKDPADNSSVDIPLWRRLSKDRVARYKGPRNVKTYMMSLPSIIKLSELQSELDESPITSFTNAVRVSVEFGAQGDDDSRDLESDERQKLETLNFAVMGKGGDVRQSILGIVNGVDRVSRTRKQAERMAEQIPKDLMRKVAESNMGIDDEHRNVFTTDKDIVIGLCKQLSVVNAVSGSRVPDCKATYIFGWCVQSGLWLETRRDKSSLGDGARIGVSMPVPILTFWKFKLPNTLDAL